MTEDSIAVAHEHYIERGGGEHVADALARTFDADLFAGLVREEETADDLEATSICDGLLGAVMQRSVAVRDLAYWQAWRHSPALHDYDIVIQSGNNPGWYIPSDDQTIVKYVHSPQRTPYDRWTEGAPNLFRRAYAEAARQLYQETLARPDVFVANSDLVARRVQLYWGIDEERIEVVYPPTDTESYGPGHADASADYYFTFSRLYPSKRVGEIVRAFDRLGDDYQLVVGGDGPARDSLEQSAGSNVDFVGHLTETEKRRRLAECRALIFNAYREDFGMVPVETMASGSPVIGVQEGFTQHQVQDGQNGCTYARGVSNLAEAVKRFDENGVAWSPPRIQQFAEQFSLGRFRQQMRKIVSEAADESAISPNFTSTSVAEPEAGDPVAVTDGGDHD